MLIPRLFQDDSSGVLLMGVYSPNSTALTLALQLLHI